MKKRNTKQAVKIVCPHCEQEIHLLTESQGRSNRRRLAKAERCKYFGSGLEYMPPQDREKALKDIVETLGVSEDKADGIRSTLQRSGIWSFDHVTKTYRGIKWTPETKGTENEA